MTIKQHILILPRWYPNKTDVQLGSFIQQQAILLKDQFHIHVIYAQAIENLNQTFDIESSTENGIDEHIVYFRSAKGPLKKVINARRYKKAQQLAFILDPYSPSLCHIHVPYRSAFLALRLQKSGVPYVITEHWSGHINGEYEQKNSADKRLLKVVLSNATKIATVSQLLRKKFKENTGFDSEVIPNLINPPAINASANSEKIELLLVADLNDEIKNISGLLFAFKGALEINPNLQLTIIGGGPDDELLHEMTSDLKLNEEVQFRGRLPYEKVLPAYQNCDFYVCNSNVETFGMAAAEALMAGKPIISSKCGGPEEYINSANGILIETNNVAELTEAILTMAETYQNYDTAALKKEMEQKFGAKTIREKLSSFYLKAIND